MMVCGRFSGCGYMSENVGYAIDAALVIVMLIVVIGAVRQGIKRKIPLGQAVEWALLGCFNLGLIYYLLK